MMSVVLVTCSLPIADPWNRSRRALIQDGRYARLDHVRLVKMAIRSDAMVIT